MQKHEHYEELCALAALGQLSEEEYCSLTEHMDSCGTCRDSVEKFSLVLTHLPDEQDEISGKQITELHEASYRDRFLGKAEREGFQFSRAVREGRIQRDPWHLLHMLMQMRVPIWIPVSAVAVLVLFLGFVLRVRLLPALTPAQRLAGAGDSREVHPSLATSPESNSNQSDQSVTAQQAADRIAELQRKISSLEAALQFYKSKDQQLRDELSSANDQLATTKEDSLQKQASLDSMNSELSRLKADSEKLRTDHSTDVASLVDQQMRLTELSEQLTQQRQAVSQEQQLTAAAGDVRQMMGARNLHIIDVYDVNGQGRARKSFGRIFYTEGQSLLFYAFDLAQKSKSGVTKVSFQAWGQRESGGAVPRNLGILTLEDRDQQRWVLRINDPKKFEGIDSLFVTVERHGGANQPAGKKLLYAYIGIPANHP
jgi:hypothetical protein